MKPHVLALCALVVSACSGDPMSPHEDEGLFATTTGVFGGGYRADVEERRQAAEDAAARGRQIEKEAARSEEELKAARVHRLQLEEDVLALRTEIDDLRARARNHRERAGADDARLRELEEELRLADERAQRLDVDPQMQDQSLAALQDELARLQEEALLYEEALDQL